MANPTIKAQHLVEYQNLADEIRALIALAADGTGIASITNNVGYWNAAGVFIPIFAPSIGASDPRMVASRDYGYFVDGVAIDEKKWHLDNGLSKWGIDAPADAPSVSATSGSSQAWVASTVFSTMGLLTDQNSNIQQLISTNANNTNPVATESTPHPAPNPTGLSGVGTPPWTQVSGGTTTDGPITWTNRGPIGLWQPSHLYKNIAHNGTTTNPAAIYDPDTDSVYVNTNFSLSDGTSGATRPAFTGINGQFIADNGGDNGTGVGWFCVKPLSTWQNSHAYLAFAQQTHNGTNQLVSEPSTALTAFDTLTQTFTSTIYLQSCGNTATSSASFGTTAFSDVVGGKTSDNQLLWLSMGSKTWIADTAYTQWVGNGRTFSVVQDPNGNYQVAMVSGTSGNSQPTWQLGYGDQTTDGSLLVWVNVGPHFSWAASTSWFMGPNGWSVPTSAGNFTGATVLDSNGDLETIISTGKSGSVQPTWQAAGLYTSDGGTPFVLTQVAVSGTTTTYTGTITGGAANAFAGHTFLIAGFVNVGNNSLIQITASTATTLVCVTGPQTNETHAATAAGSDTSSAIWFNLGLAPTGGGDISLSKGREYFLIFWNSTTGNFSTLSPVSVSTGLLTNGQVFLGNLDVSNDPQVDQKIILATADGGDQTTLYFLVALPNATRTFVDTVPELTLLAQNIYQETDISGIEHGVADNDPPPNGSFPIKYRGRLYLLVGSFLFFSKSLAELTTSTGLIAGRYEEDWPADYQMDISEGAEIGRGLFTDGFSLYIGTQRHIRRITGDGPTNFTSPEIIFNEVGINNQDVWQSIFLEGTPAGSMWLTPDFRVIRSDFQTYKNVGTEIQTTLNSINTSASNACWASYVGIDGYNFYVLAVPTGVNTQPDTFCVYNISTGRWFIWTLADLTRCGLFYLNLAGIPRFIVNANDGSIYGFDTSVSLDRATGVDRVGITSVIKTVFTDMNDATMRKALNEVEIATTQENMRVTVDGASSIEDFNNPNVVIANGTLTENFLGELKLYLAGLPSHDRFYRLTVTDTSNSQSTADDEILSYYSFEAIPLHRN